MSAVESLCVSESKISDSTNTRFGDKRKGNQQQKESNWQKLCCALEMGVSMTKLDETLSKTNDDPKSHLFNARRLAMMSRGASAMRLIFLIVS